MHYLGDIKFTGFLQPGSMSQGIEAVYAEHPKLQGKPAIQRTGSKNDTASLTLNFNRGFCIPENEIEALRKHLEAGTIMALGTEARDFLGEYVLTTMSIERSNAGPNGSLIAAAVSVSLLEWATVDGTADRKQAARTAGFAVSSNNPPITANPTLTNRVESEAMQQALASGGNVAAIDSSLVKATSDPTTTAHQRIVIRRKLDSIIADGNAARTTINAFGGQKYTDTRGMETDLLALVASATTMQAAVDSASVATIKTLAADLPPLINNLRSSAQLLAKYTGTRS